MTEKSVELRLSETVLKPRIQLPFLGSLDICDILNIYMKTDLRPAFKIMRYRELVDEANCGGFIP